MSDIQSGERGSAAEVAVIGGGLAGMTAAWTLQKAGVPCVVLESSARLGGRVKTVRVGDCLLDTGAVGMLGSYAEMAALARELGLDAQLSRGPVCLAVPRDGQLHVIDMGRPTTALSTGLLSGSAKWQLRKLGGPLLKLWRRMNFESVAGLADMDRETVGAFARRELGDEAYDYLIGPIIRALWQRDAEDTPLIDLFCSLKVFAPTMYAIEGGLQRLPDTLAPRLSAWTETQVQSVEDGADGVQIRYERGGQTQTRTFRQAVLAVPPAVATQLLQPRLAALEAAFAAQRYSCSVNVHLALSKRLGGKVLVAFPPEREAPDLTTVVFEHNKSPERAPADKGCLSLYWRDSWSRARMDADDASIVRDAIEQTRRVVPELQASMVEAAYVERWPFAGVCRSVGGTHAVAEIERIAGDFRNLALAGDYFVLSGMNAAVVSGRKAAQRILARRGAAS